MLYNELRSSSQPGHKYMLFCNIIYMSEAANGPTTYIVISIIRCHMVSYGVIITAHESSMTNPESYNCALVIATAHYYI
jgi:hypothetical protein